MRKFTGKCIADLDKNYRINLINSVTGFKSLNLVSTENENGQFNLAIFNSVIHVGSNPPLLGMLIRPPTVPRHTLDNIRRTGYYSINQITEDIYFRSHQTAARYDKDKSEFDAVGLTQKFSDTYKIAYVSESPVQVGLKLREEHLIDSNNTIFLVGEIVEMYAKREAIMSDGLINLSFINTLAGSGLDAYFKTIPLNRLSYPDPGSELESK